MPVRVQCLATLWPNCFFFSSSGVRTTYAPCFRLSSQETAFLLASGDFFYLLEHFLFSVEMGTESHNIFSPEKIIHCVNPQPASTLRASKRVCSCLSRMIREKYKFLFHRKSKAAATEDARVPHRLYYFVVSTRQRQATCITCLTMWLYCRALVSVLENASTCGCLSILCDK